MLFYPRVYVYLGFLKLWPPVRVDCWAGDCEIVWCCCSEEVSGPRKWSGMEVTNIYHSCLLFFFEQMKDLMDYTQLFITNLFYIFRDIIFFCAKCVNIDAMDIDENYGWLFDQQKWHTLRSAGPKELHYAVGGGLLTLPQKVLMEDVSKLLGMSGDVWDVWGDPF